MGCIFGFIVVGGVLLFALMNPGDPISLVVLVLVAVIIVTVILYARSRANNKNPSGENKHQETRGYPSGSSYMGQPGKSNNCDTGRSGKTNSKNSWDSKEIGWHDPDEDDYYEEFDGVTNEEYGDTPDGMSDYDYEANRDWE